MAGHDDKLGRVRDGTHRETDTGTDRRAGASEDGCRSRQFELI